MVISYYFCDLLLTGTLTYHPIFVKYMIFQSIEILLRIPVVQEMKYFAI